MMRNVPLITIAFAALACASSVAAQDLTPTVNRLTTAWARGDYHAIGSRAAKSGLAIALEGERTGPYTERQAASALKRLFEDHETLAAEPGKGGVLEGDPRRAYVEINWMTRSRGSRAREQMKVVLSLVEEGNDWRIKEIRLMK